jgi:hypothetical protein
MKIFAQVRGERPDKETKAQTDKGIDPHAKHQDKRGHGDVQAEQLQAQEAEAQGQGRQPQQGPQQQPKQEASRPQPKLPASQPLQREEQGRPERQERLAASFAAVAHAAVDELRKAYGPSAHRASPALSGASPTSPMYRGAGVTAPSPNMLRGAASAPGAAPPLSGAAPSLSNAPGAAPLRHTIRLDRASMPAGSAPAKRVDNAAACSSAAVPEELRAQVDKLPFIVPVEAE